MPPLPTLNLPLRAGRRLFGSKLLETIVSPNGVDGYGELIDPTFSLRDVRAEVTSVRRQTERSVTLTLTPNGNWQGFAAGQHVGLIFEVDGVLETRFYSPASVADETGSFELTVSLHEGGRVSPQLIERAKKGMVLGVTPAEGDFTLAENPPDRLLLIGGGSGITPVMSILRTLVARGHDCEITFIHFARSQADALYREELAAIEAAHPNIKVVHGFTREKVGGALSGHLTEAALKRVCKDFPKVETYVCGPPRLADAVAEICERRGVLEHLHSESFVLPEITIAPEDATGVLKFTRSGVEVDNDGSPLLEQAEAAGLTPRCGCRMGICHTCIAHVEEGVVRDLRSGELRTLNDEQVQTCVYAPVGEFEIDL